MSSEQRDKDAILKYIFQGLNLGYERANWFERTFGGKTDTLTEMDRSTPTGGETGEADPAAEEGNAYSNIFDDPSVNVGP